MVSEEKNAAGESPRQAAWRRVEAGVVLEALPSFWAASAEDLAAVCNGAGPRWMLRFVPRWMFLVRWYLNYFYLLDCTIAFDIHDWDYARLVATPEARVVADDRLELNLVSLIAAGRPWGWLVWLRLRRMRRMVGIVRGFGYKAFFDRGAG